MFRSFPFTLPLPRYNRLAHFFITLNQNLPLVFSIFGILTGYLPSIGSCHVNEADHRSSSAEVGSGGRRVGSGKAPAVEEPRGLCGANLLEESKNEGRPAIVG